MNYTNYTKEQQQQIVEEMKRCGDDWKTAQKFFSTAQQTSDELLDEKGRLTPWANDPIGVVATAEVLGINR